MLNSEYLIYLATLISLFAVMGLSFNLLRGFTGLLNLGHTGIILVGAYTTVLLTRTLGIPLGLAWAASAVTGAAVGLLLSLLTRKGKGDVVVGVMTLWFMILMVSVALNWIGVTRGALGLAAIPRLTGFESPARFLLLSLGVFAVVYGFLHRLTTSPFGRVLGAIRDDELGAMTLGKNAFKARAVSFVIGGAIAGLSGGLFAMLFRFIDPSSFYLTQLVTIVAIAYGGGLASLPGTVIGTLLIVLIPELLRFLPFSAEVIGAMRQIVFSTLVLIVLLWFPKGVMGKIES